MKKLPWVKIILTLAFLFMFRGTVTQLVHTVANLDSVMAGQLATLNRQ